MSRVVVLRRVDGDVVRDANGRPRTFTVADNGTLHESEAPRRTRGRPRTARPPVPGVGAYEWRDGDLSELRARVYAVVGDRDDVVHDTTRRADDDGDLLADLYAIATAFLGRALTRPEATRLRVLFKGGSSRLRRDHGDDDRRPAKAFDIARELVAWKAGLGERAMKSFMRDLRDGTRPAVETFIRL